MKPLHNCLDILAVFNHFWLVIEHGKIKYLSPADALTYLTFPGFYNETLVTEFYEFSRARSHAVGHKIHKGKEEYKQRYNATYD